MVAIDRVLETVLYVDDLEAAKDFYQNLLGIPLFSEKPGVFAFFRCGQGMLLLFDPQAAGRARGVPPHGARGPGHVCFAVAERDLPAWRARLDQAGIAIECEMDWPRGGRSFYFRDPAGNSLELATPMIWGLPDITRD